MSALLQSAPLFLDLPKTAKPERIGRGGKTVYRGPIAPRMSGSGSSSFSHGLSYTAEYRAWQTMRLRCTNPENAAYPDYGGRGIAVCDRWLNSVEAFYADMGPKPSPRHEIDRIDNDGNYDPGNCRWATRKVNDRNRRSNHLIEYRGETKTIAEWSEITGLPRDTLSKRLATGWTVDRAIEAPRAKTGTKRKAEARIANEANRYAIPSVAAE